MGTRRSATSNTTCRRKISRRKLLSGTSAAATVGIASPYLFMPRAIAQRAKELVVVHPGGPSGEAHRAAYLDPFSKETGIKVIDETGPWMEKLKAQADSGKITWDVMIDIGAFRMLQGVEQGLLQEIDYNVVTNTKDLIPKALYKFGVCSNVGSEVIAYNTKKYTHNNHPKSWAEFFDSKKVPGVRAMFQKAYGNLDIALLADGVEADKLYPLDIERAFRKLTNVKSEIAVWSSNGDQVIRLLADGEADLASAFNARVSAAAATGASIGIEWNQGFLYHDVWAVPKGAPNAPAAMQLINFMLDAQRQADFSQRFPWGPSNKKAIDLISPEKRAILPTEPKNFEKQILFGDEWWSSRLASLTTRFSTWVAQKP